MILLPKPSSPRHGAFPATASAGPAPAVPAWLRRAVPDAQGLSAQGSGTIEDVALAAGAAIAVLDAVVRRQERWAGAWRQRLALAAAAATARQAGRIEDEAALRDAVLLARPDDLPTHPGPAGLLLLAWHRLAARPAAELLTAKNLAAALEEFGCALDDEAAGDLAQQLRQLGAGAGTTGLLTGAFAAADRRGFGRVVGAWIADALLAGRLGWARAVPLLGTEAVFGASPGRSRRTAKAQASANIVDEAGWANALLAAQARAALRAVDLSAELGRRADKLLAVAPKLRARGADAIVERLLGEDALVASRADRSAGMSDRGLRRLFDRLVSLGAVRELSGRPAFRIYGL